MFGHRASVVRGSLYRSATEITVDVEVPVALMDRIEGQSQKAFFVAPVVGISERDHPPEGAPLKGSLNVRAISDQCRCLRRMVRDMCRILTRAQPGHQC